jgi:hypothetical protein
MGRFRSPKSQARHAVGQHLAIGKPRHNQKNDGKIHGIGTALTHVASLTGVVSFIADNKLDPTGKGLAGLTIEIATSYLEMRGQQVGQKQLDKDRQAMQILLGKKLPVAKSEIVQALESRAYTQFQIQLVSRAQTRKHCLATMIAADGGLRAHELYTLLPTTERAMSPDREWSDARFDGRTNFKRYSVSGKGGLVREAGITIGLAEQLESLRLDKPRIVVDREIIYEQHYDIGGGKRWTDSFSKAAQRVLGWSTGAHGVRHTFAQMRMLTLQSLGHNYVAALAIFSQEMGHFRPDITEIYLR